MEDEIIRWAPTALNILVLLAGGFWSLGQHTKKIEGSINRAKHEAALQLQQKMDELRKEFSSEHMEFVKMHADTLHAMRAKINDVELRMERELRDLVRREELTSIVRTFNLTMEKISDKIDAIKDKLEEKIDNIRQD